MTYSEFKTKLKVTNAIIFWHAVLVLSLLIIAFISPECYLIINVFMSLLAIGVILDGDGFSKTDNSDAWIFLTIAVWVMCIAGCIIYSIWWLYDKTINRFNNWLNSKQ